MNYSDPKLQLINTKPIIKSKLKYLLSELKKFKAQLILVLEFKERNYHKICHSSAKLTASDADIESIHQTSWEKYKILLVKLGFSKQL